VDVDRVVFVGVDFRRLTNGSLSLDYAARLEGSSHMYAVIESGGKQYRVSEGETLRVEKLAGPAGTKISFGPLLVTDDGGTVSVGRPTVGGMTVEAEIVEQGLGKKIIIFKYKRRKSYRRKAGHRQPFTALKITAISAA